MTMLSLIASAWAAAMVVFGLTLLTKAPSGWLQSTFGLPAALWNLLGLASIACGQFVFMFMVADRICPRAGRLPMIWLTELAIAFAGLTCLAATGIIIMTGFVL
ncbi:MAG: hypothetical protein Phyf2KO_09000 [Phycisphaerales bacterium]